MKSLVPAEGFEPPTNGLQDRRLPRRGDETAPRVGAVEATFGRVSVEAKMWRVDIRMWRAVKALTVVVAAQILVPCIPPASAHHLMGGKLPGNAWEGFLSGLGHPIIGPDHFAFVVGVGLI